MSLFTPRNHIGGAEVLLHSFLTWALDGGVWSASCPGCFTPRKEPQHPLTRWLSGPRAGLNIFEKGISSPPGIQTADHPTCNVVTVPTIQTLKVRYKKYKNYYQFLWQILNGAKTKT
jgi:hypothetical protein